jgi:hypothetical protein
MSETKECKSLVIFDNKLIKCNTLVNKNDQFCYRHKTMNKFYETLCECCICCEDINKNLEIPLECGHIFHKECIIKFNKNQCPLCKKNYTYTEINYYKNEDIIININNNLNVRDYHPSNKKCRKIFIITFLLCVLMSVLIYLQGKW